MTSGISPPVVGNIAAAAYLGNEAHAVHGGDAGAARNVQLGEHRQPQQRGHRIVRQPRRAPQAQLEFLQIWPPGLACKETMKQC